MISAVLVYLFASFAVFTLLLLRNTYRKRFSEVPIYVYIVVVFLFWPALLSWRYCDLLHGND
jgi:hypothetical protein